MFPGYYGKVYTLNLTATVVRGFCSSDEYEKVNSDIFFSPYSLNILLSDEKKRKSKWDSLPQVTGSRPGVVNPTAVASLTVSATGTKSTVIPAVGNITKKSKS